MRDIRNRLFQFIISLLKTAALCTKFPELPVDLFGKPSHIAATGRKEDQGIRVILQLLEPEHDTSSFPLSIPGHSFAAELPGVLT